MKKLATIALIVLPMLAFSDSTWRWQVSPSFQLGSTRYTTNLVVGSTKNNHLLYFGAKSQLTNSFSYANTPVGLVLGYGYRLLENKKWHFYLNPDLQWMSWKSPTKSSRNHHMDFTLNYRLSYILSGRVSLNSSMGFGFAIRHHKNEAIKRSITRPEVNGMMQVGLSYLF